MSIAVLYRYKDMIDSRLHELSKNFGPEPVLVEAMSYALDGGKRLRGAILLSFSEALGGSPDDALDFAAALEMIQAYSLVHDDLPCMDNDDFRRGKPSCHKQFGYATALLAGDALLTAAFEVAASSAATSPRLPSDRIVRAITVLSQAAGPAGMVGGQVLDLAMEGRALGADRVREMYNLKTGALFQAAARIGAVLAGASQDQEEAAARWGSLFGYAFQVLDDLEDASQSQTEEEKDTLVRETSPDDARKEAEEALTAALTALERFGGRDTLARHLTAEYLKRAT
ncbi:MAG: polyprenyl synthetase family protein [Bacillota bacterium]